MNTVDPEKWTTKQVAARLGVETSTVSSYLAHGQMPSPDARSGPHNGPWWWSTTIISWVQPGQGIGGEPKQKK